MSDRNEASGQFAEPAFGQEGLEREAGYVPFKEKEPDADTDELTVKQAAAILSDQEAEPEARIVSIPEDENVSLTLEQATAHLAKEHKVATAESERAAIEAELAELGIDLEPEAEAEARPEAQEAAPELPVREGELDPEIEKALSNPRVQAALAQHVGEVEAERQKFAAAVDGASEIAIAAFMGQFPEFAHIPAEHQSAAIQAMQQQDPARAAQIAAQIQRTLGLFEQRSALQKQEEQKRQINFNEFVQAENAKFAKLTKGESRETMNAVPALIQEILEESDGVDMAQFKRLLGSSELLVSAEAQLLLVYAAKYKQIMKASKAVSSRQLPNVQRPGAARSASERSGDDIGSLNRRLSQSGDINDAVALLAAQRKARG